MLTQQAFPGRVYIGETIAWASTNHQVKRAPFFNLQEKKQLAGGAGNGEMNSLTPGN